MFLNCKFCGNSFKTYPYLIKQGYGKYCSLICRSKGIAIEFPQKKKELSKEDIEKRKEYKRKWTKTHYSYKPVMKKLKENPIIICECGCGKELLKYSRGGYMRRFIHGHQAILYRKVGERPPHHEIQYLSIWNKIRKEIYKRDKWMCCKCKKHCQKDIQCHHIVPYRISKDNSPKNLITLCLRCHAQEEHKYNKWGVGGNFQTFTDTPHFERCS